MKLQLALPFLLLGFLEAADIRVCVKFREYGTDHQLPNAKIKCWDEDYLNGDDAMTGERVTDSSGCVTLSYSKKKPKWYNPCAGWDCEPYSNPDIYCKIEDQYNGVSYGYGYDLYTDTKEDFNQNNLANFGTVKMYPNRVLRGDPGTTNGCGSSDFNFLGINNAINFLTGFEDMCDNHDLCYESCGETQQTCDDEFRAMMYSKCNDDHDSVAGKDACKLVADGMYTLVDTLGGDIFDNSQTLC